MARSSPAPLTVTPGRPFPLGSTLDAGGVNFALFSQHATAVELCLFDSPSDHREAHRLPVRHHTDGIWHTHVTGLTAGQAYAYRVHGPFRPAEGHRFNPHKLLLDPYTRALARAPGHGPEMFAYPVGHPEGDLAFDATDNAPTAPLAVVVADPAPAITDRPAIPWSQTVIYELHVRGMTRNHPDVPDPLRGTFAGLACPPVIDYLRQLGVTTLELMPVAAWFDEPRLTRLGLSNYWGYNPIAFFAPEPRLAADPSAIIAEFRAMTDALHQAGFEVLLDVVFNHTGEGLPNGPTLAYRGLDNAAYYRLAPSNRALNIDYTGCGNTLNVSHPRVLQLIADALRYWVTVMGVDGFRFDLTSALIREPHDLDFGAGFLDILTQDPLLNRCKLIAEPWDLGEGGYAVGRFPGPWREWNGRYRDGVRSFWRGEPAHLSELATRLCGSPDLYAPARRPASAGINYVACHDGFTLADLVTYQTKRNHANGEDNRDGPDDERGWNCGTEGPTPDPAINELRLRQRRNLLLSVLLSQGVPMITAGDEFGRTQLGNNNAYCQDSSLSWLDWNLDPDNRDFRDFIIRAIALRQTQPALRRSHFPTDPREIAWFGTTGQPLTDTVWRHPDSRTLALLLAGDELPDVDVNGQPYRGNTILIVLSAAAETVYQTLPHWRATNVWELQLDTAHPALHGERYGVANQYAMAAHALAVFTAGT